MPDIPELPDADGRARAARLTLSIAKAAHSSMFGPSGNFGAEVDAIFVFCAVAIGHAERRPMTAHKISLFIEMPRATVCRKLNALLLHDVVRQISRGRYVVSEKRIAAHGHKRVFDFVEALVPRPKL